MRKLIIDGNQLREEISNKNITNKNAASLGKIGEKTLYRMLNGEPIKEKIIINFFKNLQLNHSNFILDTSDANEKDSGKTISINNVAKSNSETILYPFEMPSSSNIPSLTIWDFDIANPSDEILELLKKFNTLLEEYFNFEEINSLNFEGSFTRLEKDSKINKIVKELFQHNILTFSRIFKYHKTNIDYPIGDGTRDIIEKHYNSSYRLYLYFTRNRLLTHIYAKINIGTVPPIKREDGYHNVVVDGDYDYYNKDGEIDIPF